MTCIYPLISRVVRRSVLGEGLVFMLFFHPFNRMSSLVGGGGFSLPGVLVGVGLLGISSVIISNTVVDVRRSQQRADIKLSSNKLQQAVLDAVTGRIKEFMLDNCSGTRWGGTGSTEVEKAFSRIDIPLSGTSSGGASPALSFYKEAGGTPTSIPTSFECSEPAGPALMNSSDPNSGQYLRFCMNIDPTGHSSVSQRLLELLVVPIDLASDSAITCAKARGAAAGVKVTWQMHNKINNDKVKASGSGVQVLKESGTFLISAETAAYSGTCNITATRQDITEQCTVNVSGLGRRPPTLIKNGAVAAGITWLRAPSANNDAFTTTAICETNQPTNFVAQSADGGSPCPAAPVQPTYTLTTSVSPAGTGSISRSPNTTSYTHGSSVTLTATPTGGYSFFDWSGACSGPSSTCTVLMNNNKSVTANFKRSCNISVVVGGGACCYDGGTHTIAKSIIFPSDATGIVANLYAVGHDDGWPQIKINDVLIYTSQYGGLATTVNLNPVVNVGHRFNAGINTFWGQVTSHDFVNVTGNAWGIHGYFNISYKTSGACFTSAQMAPP